MKGKKREIEKNLNFIDFVEQALDSLVLIWILNIQVNNRNLSKFLGIQIRDNKSQKVSVGKTEQKSFFLISSMPPSNN